jgi:hypothetical protein
MSDIKDISEAPNDASGAEGDKTSAPTSIAEARRSRLKAIRKEQYQRAKARAKERASSPAALAAKERAKEKRRAAYDQAKARAKASTDAAKGKRQAQEQRDDETARAARDAELMASLKSGDQIAPRARLTLIKGGEAP